MAYSHGIRLDPSKTVGSDVSSFICSFPSVQWYVAHSYLTGTNGSVVDLECPYGEFMIQYNGHNIRVDHQTYGNPVGIQDAAVQYSQLVLSSNNKEVLLQFIEAARQYNHGTVKRDKVTVYIAKGGEWKVTSNFPKRALDSVFLPTETIHRITTDIEKFVGEEETYVKLGVPYKRNYLLEGLPGTGKTSLLFALASHFKMNLAILDFGQDMDDFVLKQTVANIPDQTILVLEDIDVISRGCVPVEKDDLDEFRSCASSLSGLLNVLDGIGHRHGLITVITTNHKDKLEDAFLRAGRIDYTVHFTYALPSQTRAMFLFFLEHQSEHLETVLARLNTLQLTTATLQQFFFQHRNCTSILDHLNELGGIE